MVLGLFVRVLLSDQFTGCSVGYNLKEIQGWMSPKDYVHVWAYISASLGFVGNWERENLVRNLPAPLGGASIGSHRLTSADYRLLSLVIATLWKFNYRKIGRGNILNDSVNFGAIKLPDPHKNICLEPEMTRFWL
jgi:hypothetical protein